MCRRSADIERSAGEMGDVYDRGFFIYWFFQRKNCRFCFSYLVLTYILLVRATANSPNCGYEY